MKDSEPYIYILCSDSDWQTTQKVGKFNHPSLESEGFIHASIPRQLDRVANKYYKDAPALCLLKIDTGKLSAPLRWEAISSGDLYPHIYGTVPLESIIHTQTLLPVEAGRYSIAPETIL